MFPYLIQDELRLFAAIQYAAASIAHYDPDNAAKQRIARAYHGETLRRLQRRLEMERKRPSNATIHTTISMLAVATQIPRELFQDGPSSHRIVHSQGLRSLLNQRGAWSIENYDVALQWDLYW